MALRIEFECVICGRRAKASVSEADIESADRPLETLNECDTCSMETIWIET
jgi:DNA-directed RNA polymerase subunit M/transcription elongation factor TFIIS